LGGEKQGGGGKLAMGSEEDDSHCQNEFESSSPSQLRHHHHDHKFQPQKDATLPKIYPNSVKKFGAGQSAIKSTSIDHEIKHTEPSQLVRASCVVGEQIGEERLAFISSALEGKVTQAIITKILFNKDSAEMGVCRI
jgi:hypothetical protein